jgi:hypothetical protein
MSTPSAKRERPWRRGVAKRTWPGAGGRLGQNCAVPWAPSAGGRGCAT